MEEEHARIRLPNKNNGEIFAIAEQLVGGSRIKVFCEDGKYRMTRIPGRMKRRSWIRNGDLLIIKPWDFQDDKADIVFRYTKTEASNLMMRGILPSSMNI
jgi:translation initiation factor 1A